MNPDSVIFVERIVPNYRVPFFLGLHEALNKQDICLRVLGGKCLPQEHLVDAIHELPFGEQIHNIYFHHGIYLQQGLHDHIKGIRLIITGQENRALSINRLLLQQQFSQIIPPIAFYDHGPVADTKSISSAVNYAVKKALSLRANWWFAYTEISKCRLIRCGFDPSRITVANNAIDTKQILAAQQHADLMQLTSSYNKLFNDNISDIQKVIIGIVCMRLVAGKKVDFLLSTLDFIHKEVENFRMLIIGEGTKKQVIQNYCSTRPWCKYLGALYGG
ncbi:MAG TPA: hypothetical protein ENI62_01635, partial [Gammaproteobacteria bacterium]|nr:hypothetical protein [Gammaproteobacteria bacterium]